MTSHDRSIDQSKSTRTTTDESTNQQTNQSDKINRPIKLKDIVINQPVSLTNRTNGTNRINQGSANRQNRTNRVNRRNTCGIEIINSIPQFTNRSTESTNQAFSPAIDESTAINAPLLPPSIFPYRTNHRAECRMHQKQTSGNKKHDIINNSFASPRKKSK